MIEFIDKTDSQSGTKINRAAMMAIQGFIGMTISFAEDGSIVETNSQGHTKTTSFLADGSIQEVFVGDKTITKTISFNSDESITEVIS